jgi:hypothetical protein
MTNPQTTFARATLEHDKTHRRAHTEAIFDTSRVSDCNSVVIRTCEAAEALPTALAGILTTSPATAIRNIDDLGKGLRRQIAAAKESVDLQEFINRTFRGNDMERTA